MKKARAPEYILTLTCPDRRGIVHAISGLLADNGCNILDSAQFSDSDTNTFFMRVQFADETGGGRGLAQTLASVGQQFALDWKLHDAAYKPRLLLMASKTGHCLNDLLFRYSSGLIHADVRGVISNHEDFRSMTESHGIKFHHLPVNNENRLPSNVSLYLASGRSIQEPVHPPATARSFLRSTRPNDSLGVVGVSSVSPNRCVGV